MATLPRALPILTLASLLGCVVSSSSLSSSRNNHHPRRPPHSFLRSLADAPKEIQPYELFTSKELEERLRRWSTHYTDLTRLTTAQDEYDLPRAGGAKDCPHTDGEGCINSILTIQDFVAHPEGSDSSNQLPEVLWSGEVHGDEQVGPTSVMEAAELLLSAADCLALPRLQVKKDQPDEWADELQKAKECRQDFAEFGVTEKDLWWLGRIVSTRRIVVVPTANALGYYRKRREEGNIDPNRDFPYDYPPNSDGVNDQCMRTIAARTLNEVFREHLFQLSLTFHGGMEVIGYEWGAPSYRHSNISPDDAVQSQVAQAYSKYAGGWSGTVPYKTGPMNSMVYPVKGGMEDWAYAGSWDPSKVVPCKPDTFDSYPEEKTKYNNSTLRVLNMLVETSNRKIPTTHLGNSQDLLKGFDHVAGNGHISRNIRLALLAAELVQPWLAVRRVNEVELSDDVIPLMDRSGRDSCQEFKRVSVPQESNKVVIEWTVGGSLTIGETKLWYAKWSDVPDLNCLDQPPLDIQQKMTEGKPISKTSGKTKFASSGSEDEDVFSASMDLSSFAAHDRIVVLVSARVDQDWATQPNNIEPAGKKPQSHMANARTNPAWYHKSGDKIIQGRLDWYSSPVTLEIGEFAVSVDSVELTTRIPIPSGGATPSFPTPAHPSPTPANSPLPAGPPHDITPVPGSSSEEIREAETGKNWSPMQKITAFLSFLVFAGVAVLAIRCAVQERMRYGQRSRLRTFIDNKNAPTPGARQLPDNEEGEEGFQDRYTDEPTTENNGDGEETNGVEMGTYT